MHIVVHCVFLCRHGEAWREFRTKVQKPVLQPHTVKKYIQPIEEVSDYFIKRCVHYVTLFSFFDV